VIFRIVLLVDGDENDFTAIKACMPQFGIPISIGHTKKRRGENQ
jgi:hypothetical protein